MKLKIQDKGFVAFLMVCFVVILVFSFLLFGVVGLRVALGILFVSLPFYFIINNFDIGESEKFVLSFVFGITIFPSLVYALGFLISFRISIFIVFVFLMMAAILVWKFKKKEN